jgi:hypothetical protein
MKLLRFLCIISVLTLILLSCAKQSTPSGGPKDTIPPILTNSIPHDKQLNFKGDEITLSFSESVILNNPKDQIIITPSIGKDYKVAAKKKNVTIELEKRLADSTTYTMSFRESIQDITEKNPAKNLKIAFSTANYIDSLSISGTVTDMISGKEAKEITVALYQADTFNIFKHKPSYITKTSDKGIFSLENLKPEKYYIYAYDDKNKNLITDSKSELYGFIAKDTLLSTNIKNIIIPIQKLDARELKLTSARPYGNYFNIKTSKSLNDFSTSSDNQNIFSSYGEDASNIKVYNTFGKIDSLKIFLTGTDSIGNKLDTALYIKFTNRQADKEKFVMTVTENMLEVSKALLRTKIKFNKPISKVNYDTLLIKIDSTNSIQIAEEDLVWNTHKTELEIKKKIDKKYLPKKPDQKQSVTTAQTKIPENKFDLKFGKNTFISVENDSSKSLVENPKILKEEETATLLLSVKTIEKNYIVQLLDKTFKPFQYFRNTPEIKIDNLPPAVYIIRLIIDKNADGKWSLGNYLKKEEPEPTVFYKNQKGDILINLKANWEVGPLLITY